MYHFKLFSLRDPAEADTKLNWVGKWATAKSTRTTGQGLGQEDKVQRPKAKRKKGWRRLEGVGDGFNQGLEAGCRLWRGVWVLEGGLEDKENATQRTSITPRRNALGGRF